MHSERGTNRGCHGHCGDCVRQKNHTQVRVPEVWRYDGERLQMLKLKAGEYEPIAKSVALPKLTAAALTGCLERSKTTTRSDLLKTFREWLRGSRSI